MKYVIIVLIALGMTPAFALEQGGQYLIENQHETLIILFMNDEKEVEVFLDGSETILKHTRISDDGNNVRFFGKTVDGNTLFYVIYDLENDKFFSKIYDANSPKMISTAERILDVPVVTRIL